MLNNRFIKLLSLNCLTLLIIFALTSNSYAIDEKDSLSKNEYQQVLNNAYDGYLKNGWDENAGIYIDKPHTDAWTKANQAMLLFHTMRLALNSAPDEDKTRASKIINRLINDFNYSRGVKNSYITRRPKSIFLISKQHDPGSVKVFLNGKRQIQGKHFKILNSNSWASNKYVEFNKKIGSRNRITIIYRTRKTFRSKLINPNSVYHIALNYQTAEALYYALKYKNQLDLSKSQINGAKGILNKLASYSFRYKLSYNQLGLAWNSGILKYAYAATHKKLYAKKWQKDMNQTLLNLNKQNITGNIADIDGDFSFNYITSNNKDPLSWDTQEYSNIVLRALDDINYFRRKGISINNKNLYLLRGLRQFNLGNFMLNGYPNWDTAYGLNRQFFSQYWPYSLYSLKTIIATPEYKTQKNDANIARYLLDQAVISYSSADTFNNDPQDGAIANTILDVRPVFARHPDNNKMTANADFAGQVSLMLVKYNLMNIRPKKPKNMWHWAHEQQKLSVSTPYYSTTVIGSTSGLNRKKEVGLPYGGLEMTSLMRLNNTSYSMNRPGSAASSFNFRVYDLKKRKTLINTYNALVGKQSRLKHSPLALSISPNGNLKKMKDYKLKRLNLQFSKLKLDGSLSFDKGKFIFNNSHTFYNDAILLSEIIRIKKKTRRNPLRITKSFPASSYVNKIVASTNDSDTTLYDKNGLVNKYFRNVRNLNYLHYQTEQSGLLIIPHNISWGRGAMIDIGSTQARDKYNTLGVRPVNFTISSGKKTGKLSFAVYITFTDGSKNDAINKYRLYRARFKKRKK